MSLLVLTAAVCLDVISPNAGVVPTKTAAYWGVVVTPEAITAAKIKGNSNNDWVRWCLLEL